MIVLQILKQKPYKHENGAVYQFLLRFHDLILKDLLSTQIDFE